MVTRNMRTATTFAAGLIAGVLIAGCFLFAGHNGRAAAAAQVHPTYADASSRSWNQTATDAVNDLKSKGIIVTPSVAKYDGNAYVTRFEAAVLIDRFVKYVENGRTPLHPTQLESDKMPSIAQGPGHDQMVDLIKNRYLDPTSPLIQAPATKPITAKQLSDAMTSAVVRVLDRDTAPNPNIPDED
jgi:hypothetical protein